MLRISEKIEFLGTFGQRYIYDMEGGDWIQSMDYFHVSQCRPTNSKVLVAMAFWGCSGGRVEMGRDLEKADWTPSSGCRDAPGELAAIAAQIVHKL